MKSLLFVIAYVTALSAVWTYGAKPALQSLKLVELVLASR
jgi:hypothetical protein